MSIKKNIMLLSCLVSLLISCNIMASSVVSDNVVYQGSEGGKYYVIAYFNPSHKIQSDEGYSLKKGKYVKQAYVRAKSAGCVILGVRICSSYDSGRCYSKSAGASKPDKIISTPKETVSKCNTCTQTTNYGWIYYE